MTNRLFVLIISLLSIVLLFAETSCTTDQLAETPLLEFCDTLAVSYDLQVKAIIDTNCAFAGCHVSGTAAPGNYTSYSRMVPFLTDLEFKRFVIDLKNDPDLGMPPDWPTNPGPNDLTEEEFEIISCWVQEGYPEN